VDQPRLERNKPSKNDKMIKSSNHKTHRAKDHLKEMEEGEME